MHNEEGFLIRAAIPDDADEVGSLWMTIMKEHELLDARWKLADDACSRWITDFRWWVKDHAHYFLVATHSDTIVGFVHAYLWGDLPIYVDVTEVFVATIYVAPGSRRQGIASEFLDRIKKWGQENNAVRLRLGILARNNEGIRFWEKQGAEPLSIFYTIPLERKDGQDENDSPGQIGFFGGT